MPSRHGRSPVTEQVERVARPRPGPPPQATRGKASPPAPGAPSEAHLHGSRAAAPCAGREWIPDRPSAVVAGRRLVAPRAAPAAGTRLRDLPAPTRDPARPAVRPGAAHARPTPPHRPTTRP